MRSRASERISLQLPLLGCGQGRHAVLDEPISVSVALQRMKEHLGLTYLRLALGNQKTLGNEDERIVICITCLFPECFVRMIVKGHKPTLMSFYKQDLFSLLEEILYLNSFLKEHKFYFQFLPHDTVSSFLFSKVEL